MMVDRLVVRPGAQHAVHTLMTRDYATQVADRGLRLAGAWLSPPFERPGHGSELTVVWEYASLQALWTARMAEEDDPATRRIWTEIGALTESRSRHLARSEPMDLPPPDRTGRTLPAGNPPLARIVFVRPHDPVAAGDQAAWIAAAEGLGSRHDAVIASRAGFHQEYSFLPGHLTWDIASLHPIDDASLLAALPGPCDIVEAVTLGRTLDQGLRHPGQGGTKRTILLRTRSDADPETLAAFELALAETPLYITAIDNWRLSRIAADSSGFGWTHCFEQEVADASVFVGDYLNHPYHWAVVERLFHPEAPERVGDGFLHTLYPIDRSVLASQTVS